MLPTLGRHFDLLEQVLESASEHFPLVQGLAFDGLGGPRIACIVQNFLGIGDLLARVCANGLETFSNLR